MYYKHSGNHLLLLSSLIVTKLLVYALPITYTLLENMILYTISLLYVTPASAKDLRKAITLGLSENPFFLETLRQYPNSWNAILIASSPTTPS